MKDPEEQDEKMLDENAREVNEQSKPTEESNWDEHQRIDEEGNKLDPDDIK